MTEFPRSIYEAGTGEGREHVWLDVVQVIRRRRGRRESGSIFQEMVAFLISTVTLGILLSPHLLYTETPLLLYKQTECTACSVLKYY
jgi:hypothetical protein